MNSETLDDIEEELREHNEETTPPWVCFTEDGGLDVTNLIDRINAARQRDPANSAVMYKALEKIYELVMQIVEKTEDADVACDAWDISELCENALNAPPRNCDIGTPAEQNEKFLDSEDYNDYQKNGAIAAFVWGQKPCENE